MSRELADLGIPDAAIAVRALLASGPGGQNVNKVSTAIELRVDLRLARLDPGVHARLLKLAGHRVSKSQILVIEARRERSQERNRADAFARVRALVTAALVRPKPRRATKPSRAARERRLETKKRQGEKKAGRRGLDQ